MKDKLIEWYFKFNTDYGYGERPTALIAASALVMLLTLIALPVESAQ